MDTRESRQGAQGGDEHQHQAIEDESRLEE
jgi:hypothetical protein